MFIIVINIGEIMENTIYSFQAKDIDGQSIKLEQFKEKVILIVNVASKCGFTSQYEGLEKIYKEYKDKGLIILGFPCNQFGAQESGSEKEIKEFCSLTYDVTFPMFSKINVNGSDTHPLYEFLKEKAPGLLGSKKIKWNFTKFLIDKKGTPVKRYAPNDKPEKIATEIEQYL